MQRPAQTKTQHKWPQRKIGGKSIFGKWTTRKGVNLIFSSRKALSGNPLSQCFRGFKICSSDQFFVGARLPTIGPYQSAAHHLSLSTKAGTPLASAFAPEPTQIQAAHAEHRNLCTARHPAMYVSKRRFSRSGHALARTAAGPHRRPNIDFNRVDMCDGKSVALLGVSSQQKCQPSIS